MKKILTAVVLASVAGTAMADITVKANPALEGKEFKVEYGYISDLTKPRMERPEPLVLNGVVKNGEFKVATLPNEAAQYVITTGDREYVPVYTMPGDELVVTLTSVQPLDYSIKGSKLMEDVSKLDMETAKITQQAQAIMSSENPDPAAMEQLMASYENLFKDYIKANPESPAVPYAIMNLEGQDFLDAYAAMTPAAKNSPIMVFAERQKKSVEKHMEAEKRMAELQSGTMVAPDFTFDNLEGKPVSLSDFRGKWVVIDFWGSWCRWCIKGFPELKEAYAKLQPELVVLGVACNDKPDAWRNAIKKFELPWVNVYNPASGGGKVLEDYAVEGFPTKVIVSPEGIIKNITVGEDPEFFTILEKLVKNQQ